MLHMNHSYFIHVFLMLHNIWQHEKKLKIRKVECNNKFVIMKYEAIVRIERVVPWT